MRERLFNKEQLVKHALISVCAVVLYVSYLFYKTFGFTQYELSAEVPFTTRTEIGKIYGQSPMNNLRIVVSQDEFIWAKFILTEKKEILPEQIKEKMHTFLKSYYTKRNSGDVYIEKLKGDIINQKIYLKNFNEQCKGLRVKHTFNKDAFPLCEKNIIEGELRIMSSENAIENLKQNKQPVVLTIHSLSQSIENKRLIILSVFCWIITMSLLTLTHLVRKND